MMEVAMAVPAGGGTSSVPAGPTSRKPVKFQSFQSPAIAHVVPVRLTLCHQEV